MKKMLMVSVFFFFVCFFLFELLQVDWEQNFEMVNI